MHTSPIIGLLVFTLAFFVFPCLASASSHPVDSSTTYTQSRLFDSIVLPTFKAYPEIAWFASPDVAATHEGRASGLSVRSWTGMLMTKGLLPQAPKKYVELERMLQSLVCFHLLADGSPMAYRYWIQKQTNPPLDQKSFDSLHQIFSSNVKTPANHQALIASLVYSDLGKTPEMKRRATQSGLAAQGDHDDLMESVYFAPKEIRKKIIPSFDGLSISVQNQVLSLHQAVPLHWGQVLHLEGGEKMFSRLEDSPKKSDLTSVEEAFLIQVCDVAAAQAHLSLEGSLTFNQTAYLGYTAVLTAVELIAQKQATAQSALSKLVNQKSTWLGYSSDQGSVDQLRILTRMGSFLRLYTPEEGSLLKKTAEAAWKKEDWLLMNEVFGQNSGINTWKRNPTYIPAVLMNLFNSTTEPDQKYNRALNGARVIAKIAQEYQARGLHSSDVPLNFNELAAEAKNHPTWFMGQFSFFNLFFLES